MPSIAFHWFNLSILLRATQNLTPFCFSMFKDSRVYCSNPCMISTTRTAKSHKEDPLDLRLLKDSWPGVSITRNPGSSSSNSLRCATLLRWFWRFSGGKYVAPIYWVIPPASPAWTFVFLSLSSISVFPVSTWPIIHTIGQRSLLAFAGFYCFLTTL
jgi:hypothetical protein